MISRLFRSTPQNHSIASLYGMIVAQARAPAFYQYYGVPDTVNGRLEMIMLHAVLVLQRLEGGAQPARALGQGLFDRQGGRQGIRAVLAGEGQHDAGLAHDQRVARSQRRSLFDLRHVAHQDRHVIANGDDRLSDGRRVRFRSGRFQQYALRSYVDEPRAAQRQGAACRIGHLEQRHVITRQFIGVGLDLNLPKVTGEEVLEHLQESTRCARIPVIVITSSDSAKDRAMAQRLGAAKYFRKPSDLGEFMCLGALIKGVLSGEGEA